MKTIYHVSYTELETAANNAGYELVETITGCLIDSVLYVLPATDKTLPVYIAAFETYLNCWSSALTVKIARTPGDVEKLLRQWETARNS